MSILRNFLYVIVCGALAVGVLLMVDSLLIRRFDFDSGSSSFVKSIFGQKKTKQTIFVGDIMLDRAVAIAAKTYGKENIFAGVSHIFEEADIVVGNFEGTMSTRPSIAVPGSKILRFTFDPAFAPILKEAGFTAVSLANNHSLDFGAEAYKETRDYLHEVGILTFGSALNTGTLSTTIPVDKDSFCMVGYHDLFSPDPSDVLKEISTIRSQCSHIVVFVHWGVEYVHAPTSQQRLLAQAFIDAGADLVIGAHPHIVQPVEIYNNKAIFYSIGNFVFDQNFSFATRHGLLVRVEWHDRSTRFELIPVAIARGHVSVAEEDAREKVLETATDSKTPTDIAEMIRAVGEFTLENED